MTGTIAPNRTVDVTYQGRSMRAIVAFYPSRTYGSEYVELYVGAPENLPLVDLSQACLLVIEATAIDYVYDDGSDDEIGTAIMAGEAEIYRPVSAVQHVNWAAGYEDTMPPPPVATKYVAPYVQCEKCGDRLHLIGNRCASCNHTQGDEIAAHPAFALGAL